MFHKMNFDWKLSDKSLSDDPQIHAGIGKTGVGFIKKQSRYYKKDHYSNVGQRKYKQEQYHRRKPGNKFKVQKMIKHIAYQKEQVVFLKSYNLHQTLKEKWTNKNVKLVEIQH